MDKSVLVDDLENMKVMLESEKEMSDTPRQIDEMIAYINPLIELAKNYQG
jgi:hypothetical protein